MNYLIRIRYFLLVLIVSPEMANILLFLCIYSAKPNLIENILIKLSIHEEMLKYLMFIPVLGLIWVFQNLKSIVFDKYEDTKILVKWKSYWKLKAHMHVALLYSVLFAATSILPWLFPKNIAIGSWFLLFIASCFGQLIVVVSVYFAGSKIKEIIAFNDPNE